MATNPAPDNIDLETFLKSAGESFTEAQRALVPGADVSVNMMLSNADLELKVAVGTNALGKMSIKLLSSEDIIRTDINPAMISTIRMSFVSSIGEIKSPTSTSPAAAADTSAKGNPVPNVVGMLPKSAERLFNEGGWQFELHAATSGELKAFETVNTGKVVRQQPQSGQIVDKTATTISVWIDLGSTPVNEIDGIGSKLGENLSKIGVSTIGELSLTDTAKVASALKINQTRARAFVDMAVLMSRLAIIGFKDEVVELLVRGALIHSIEQLANAKPQELYQTCREAVASKKVQVPRGFKFTLDDVKKWVKAAASYAG